MDKQSTEYKFLTFFDSVQMLGWKSIKQVNFYWEIKKLSSIFIFVGFFSNLLHLLLPIISNPLEQMFYIIVLILPLTACMGFFFYISLDYIFEKIGGHQIALNHIARVWSRSNESLIHVLMEMDDKIISPQDKFFLVEYPYNPSCLHIIYKTWKKAIHKELDNFSNSAVS